MARIVIKEEKSPIQLGSQWICRCGLSKNQPDCDASHKMTTDEEDGKVYVYYEDGREEQGMLDRTNNGRQDHQEYKGCCGNCQHHSE